MLKKPRIQSLKLLLSIIFTTVFFPYLTFMLSQVTLSLFNPVLQKPLTEHLMNAFDKNANIVFFSIEILYVLLISLRVKPLLTAIHSGTNKEKALKVILNLPINLIIINLLIWMAGVSAFYLIFSSGTAIPFHWSMLMQVSGGLLGSMFMVQFMKNFLIKYKILLNLSHKVSKRQDIYARNKDNLIYLSIILFIIVFLGYISRYYYVAPTVEYIIKFELAMGIYSFILLVFSFGLLYISRREYKTQVKFLRDKLKELTSGEGDLQQRIPLINYDEVGDIVLSLNKFLDYFNKFIHTVSEFSEKTAASSFELQNTIDDNEDHSVDFNKFMTQIISSIGKEQSQVEIAQSTIDEMLKMMHKYQTTIEEQLQAVENTTGAINRIAFNLTEITQSTEKTRSTSDDLQKYTSSSSQELAQFELAINKIQNASNSVLEIVGSISNIAETTNILALNASIEASHAGEAGKGFSTVASEIKTLAKQSGVSAKSIVSQIKIMNQQISSGITLMNQMKISLADMFPMISDIIKQITSISRRMNEDQVGVHQIVETSKLLLESSNKMKEISQLQSAKSDEITHSVSTLQQASQNTKEMISSIGSQLSSMKNVNSEMKEVSNINQVNTEKILDITKRFVNYE